MTDGIPRRDFLKTAPLAALALGAGVAGSAEASAAAVASPLTAGSAASPAAAAAKTMAKLQAFDYQGVRLRPSRWQRQMEAGRQFFLAASEDDVLHGYRADAGLAAPGKPLGGWCGKRSDTVFGQWLSGMSRLSRATGDGALREKAVRLFTEWAKTVKPNGDTGMRHYGYDKLVCGLVDLQLYADCREAGPVLERTLAYAMKSFERPQAPLASATSGQGRPSEWYTLSENLYRASQLTGDAQVRAFADEWRYTAYWNKFATTSRVPDAHGVHAYSHVNTFSSAAMTYEITGDPAYLAIIKNAYDYLQHVQCYATGGYGPNERFVAPDGSLGRSLDTRSDTCEAGCGSWAVFKLSRYLTQFTGDAHYGDWMERMFYNGIGAALPLSAGGKNFYYADYRVGSGMKVFNYDVYTCCSGSYAQNMADFHNLIYYRDAQGLYVNLYVPSDVTWKAPNGSEVVLLQETDYPDADTTQLTLTTRGPVTFPLKFRVPAWTRGAVTVQVNDAPVSVDAKPGTWATIARTWNNGDRVKIQIPLTMRQEAVDAQHPDRVAVVRGPVVLVLEASYHDPNFRLPFTDEELAQWLVPEKGTKPTGILTAAAPDATFPTIFRVAPPDKSSVRLKFRPFYEVPEGYPYFMYFDRKALPWKLW